MTPRRLKFNKDKLRLPYLVLIVSLLVTIGITYIFYKSGQEKDFVRFKQQALQTEAAVNSRIRTYLALLKSARGFVETIDEIDRDSFRRYINSLELQKNFPGIQGVGYAGRVLSYEAEFLAQKMESEGVTGYKIYPETSKFEYIPVVYLEPLTDQNRKALGFDMSSEPIRKTALDKARDLDDSIATGKVFLVQEREDERQPGFLIYTPVFKDDVNPTTIEDRQRLLEGYVYCAFRASNFLNEIKNSSPNEDISVTIYDDSISPDNILAQSQTGNDVPEFTSRSEMNFAGKRWILEYKTLPSFAGKSNTDWTFWLFVGGLIFSLLLFAMTYLETYARQRSESMAKELRESEKEKARLFEQEQIARHFAEDASRAKDEFISVVSHELRTPLNSIAGWTRILRSEKLAPEMKAQALEKIERNLRIQTHLVEELLDFSGIFSDQNEFAKEKFVVSEVFESAFAEAENYARTKEIVIEKNNALHGQTIVGDSDKIRKAYENVLQNAVKFTPEKGYVKVDILERDRTVELCVEDTGQGINPKFLPHIFEGFKQADSSSTRQHGGLGLGLAISRHICEMHGGTISAESPGVGKGAIFRIKIPLQENGHNPSIN